MSSDQALSLVDKILPPFGLPYEGPVAAVYFNYLYTFWNLSRTVIHITFPDSGARYPGFDTSGKQGLDIVSLIA